MKQKFAVALLGVAALTAACGSPDAKTAQTAASGSTSTTSSLSSGAPAVGADAASTTTTTAVPTTTATTVRPTTTTILKPAPTTTTTTAAPTTTTSASPPSTTSTTMGTVSLIQSYSGDKSPDGSYTGQGGCDRTGMQYGPPPCSAFYRAPTYTPICSYFSFRVRNGINRPITNVTLTGAKTYWNDYNAPDMTKMDQYQTGEIFDAQDVRIEGGSIAPGSTATVHTTWCSRSGPPPEDWTPYLALDIRTVSLGWQ